MTTSDGTPPDEATLRAIEELAVELARVEAVQRREERLKALWVLDPGCPTQEAGGAVTVAIHQRLAK